MMASGGKGEDRDDHDGWLVLQSTTLQTVTPAYIHASIHTHKHLAPLSYALVLHPQHGHPFCTTLFGRRDGNGRSPSPPSCFLLAR